MDISPQMINVIVEVLVAVIVLVAILYIDRRQGMKAATAFVTDIMSSPVIQSAIKGLRESVPPEAFSALIAAIQLGGSLTTDPDTQALLAALRKLLELNGVTLPANATAKDVLTAMDKHMVGLTINPLTVNPNYFGAPPPSTASDLASVYNLTTPKDVIGGVG